MPHWIELIQRIASVDPRVHWTKLQKSGLHPTACWECRMNRKYRLITSNRNLPLEVVGFASRGDKTFFRFSA